MSKELDISFAESQKIMKAIHLDPTLTLKEKADLIAKISGVKPNDIK